MDYPEHPLIPTILAALHGPAPSEPFLIEALHSVLASVPQPLTCLAWLAQQPFHGVTVPPEVLAALHTAYAPPA